MKIIIRNLSRTTTEEALRELFAPFGNIQSCTLIKDKRTNESKGFGFVEMPKAGEAKQAIKKLNNQNIDNCSIRVKKADPKNRSAEKPKNSLL
jgi:RNA recognition motif-containing protein